MSYALLGGLFGVTISLAQAEPWAPLAQWGAVGAMMYWLMVSYDKRVKALEEKVEATSKNFTESMGKLVNDLRRSIDDLAKAQLISTVAQREPSAAVRQEAERLLAEQEERRKNR